MLGPINEHNNLSSLEEQLGAISSNPLRGEDQGFEDQCNKNGYVNQDSETSIKESIVICNGKQNVTEEANALGTRGLEETDEVFSRNDLCFEKYVQERLEEKTKVSSRRGRSKRKFFQIHTDKGLGTSETDKHSVALNVQSSMQEVPSSNATTVSCSNEEQRLHVGKSTFLSDRGIEAGSGISFVFEKQSPLSCHDYLDVNKHIFKSLLSSKLKNSGTCSTTTGNDIMGTRIKQGDTKLASQILLEAPSSGPRDVQTDSMPIYYLKSDEDARRHDRIDLERDKPLHEGCKDRSSAVKSGILVFESAGREVLCDRAHDSVHLNFHDSVDLGMDKATVNSCNNATMRSKINEGNLQTNVAYAKDKTNFLEYKEACSSEGREEKVESLYEQSTQIDELMLIAEERTDILNINPNQEKRQAVKYLDAASDTAASNNFGVLSKNESCSIKSKETENSSLQETMPFYHPLEDNMLLSQDRTCSARLEVYLDNRKPNELDENPSILQSSGNSSTKVLKVPSILPMKLQLETHGVQHEKKCMDKLGGERVSKALVKPHEAISMPATVLKQDLLTLNENKGASPVTQPEEDVKVCDICGDTGYEDSLAVCSACNEGAEHIYCMRTRLMALPEGNWYCETCKGKHEVGVLSNNSCAQASTRREASTSEISFRKKISEKKHFLLSTQRKRVESDSKGVFVSNSVHEGNKLVNFGVSSFGIPSSNKQIIENADYLQLASGQAQAQGCMPKGLESGKISSSVHTTQLVTLPPSISVSGLKRQDGQPDSSKAKSSAKGSSPVPNTMESSKRKLLASTISTDVAVPNFKRKDLESNDNKPANVPTMLQPEKTSENVLKVSETSKAKSLSNTMQGKRLIGGPASRSSVQSRGKLEIKPSLSKPADLKNSSKVKDFSLTSLPAMSGNMIQECAPLEIRGLPLQVKDSTGSTVDLTDIESSRRQPDVKAVSQGLVSSTTKPILATHSKETIADNNIQVPPVAHAGESRKASQELPSLSSSSHLRLFSSHAVDPGKASIVSRIISSPIPSRCYRCKETGHIAKDCSRSLSNHAPDLWPSISWAATTFQNETFRNSPGIEKGNVLGGSFIRQSSFEEPFLSDLARPQHTVLWQGGFEVVAEGQSSFYDGIQAHPSTKAVKEVYEATRKLPSQVSLEEVQANFVPNLPDGGLIALYFKAANTESAGTYLKLLEHMTKFDLVLRGLTSTAELLVFTSNRLPQIEQCWNEEKFLWGLFRKRKLSTPRSAGVSNPWSCQRSNPSTSYFTRENNEVYSKFVRTVSSEQMCSPQILEIDTLAAKKLDAADRAVDMLGLDQKKSPLSSSRMTVFPYIQDLKPASQSERQSLLKQGLLEEKTSNSYFKDSSILPYGFAAGALNQTLKTPENPRNELGSNTFSPDFQTYAGMPNDTPDSTRQRNWLKKDDVSGAGKTTRQEFQVSNLGFGLGGVLPSSKRQINESFLSHQLPAAFPNRLENDTWHDARLYVPRSSTPSTIRAEGQLRASYVESNFGVEEKEISPASLTGNGKTKVQTTVDTAGQVPKHSLQTRNDRGLKNLHSSQEDLQKLLDRHEHFHVTSESLEHSLSHSGSQSHSSLHSCSEACSPYKVSRSSSASLPQFSPGNFSQQQIFDAFPPSTNSDFGQASKSINLTGTEVGGKALAKEPPKSISNAQLSPIEELYMHFMNEKAMHGDTCKDIIFCSEGDILVRAQALQSQKSNVNNSATKLDSKMDFKEGNYEIDSAESSISSGEPFNEQKLALDAAPHIKHPSISIASSTSLIQDDMVINTGQIRENQKWHNNITTGYAANREIPSIQPEAFTSLNLELGLGGKCSNSHQELHLLEKLSGFESTQNPVASKSKWLRVDYKKCKLLDPEFDSKHYSYAGTKDQSLSLTLAAPSQRPEPFSSGAFEGGTLVDNTECALQLFK